MPSTAGGEKRKVLNVETDRAGTDINQVRITSLFHIQGQSHVIETLKVHLRAHDNIRSSPGNPDVSFGPVILCGPSGTGKTMVARAIHAELGNLRLVETSGVGVNHKLELFSILINADENTTIFIDEAQGMDAKAQYVLLTALSERDLYVPAGISSVCSHTIRLANFTMVMATTHEYLLQDALRNRMRIHCRFTYYSVEDLVGIVRQRAETLKWKYESEEVLRIIAQRVKKNPRQALHRNLQTCWHVAQSHGRSVIDLEDVREAFYHLQIDELGLDQLDRSYLEILRECYRSSLSVLSSRLSLPALTIQRVVEPYLLSEGLIVKDKSSVRVITQKGRKHIERVSSPSKRPLSEDIDVAK